MENEKFQELVLEKLGILIVGQEKLEKRMDRLETEVNDLKTEVNHLKTEVNHLKTEVDYLKTEVGDLKQEVGVLKQEVGDLKREVGGLKKLAEETASDLKIVKEQTAKNTETLMVIRGNVEQHEEKFRKMQEALSA